MFAGGLRLASQIAPYEAMPLAVQSMGYAPELGLLFATTGAGSEPHSAALVAIRPGTHQIEWWVALGGEPGDLAVSAEERYVYVWNRTHRTVQRVSTSSRSVDLAIPSPLQIGYSDGMHGHVAALPKKPESFAIAVSTTGGPRGQWVLDGATVRPVASDGPTAQRITRILVNEEGNRLYGYVGGDTSFALVELEIAEDGVRTIRERRGVFSGFDTRVDLFGGKLYSNNGTAARTSDLRPDGRFFAHQSHVASVPAGRSEDGLIYFSESTGANQVEIRGYHAETYLLARRLALPKFRFSDPLAEACGDYLAFAGQNGLVLVRAEDIAVVPETPFPAPGDWGGIRSVGLLANDLVYSPHHHRVYASVANTAGTFGNSIAEIDPQSGSILRTRFVGSDPVQIAVSDDGQFLYVSLHGRASLLRLSLPELDHASEFEIDMPSVVSGPMDLPRHPGWLAVAPGNPHRVAFNAGLAAPQNEDRYLGGGLGVLDNGVVRMEPSGMSASPAIAFAGSPNRVFAYVNTSIPPGVAEFHIADGTVNRVAGNSIALETAVSPIHSAPMVWQNGRLFLFNGVVFNPDELAMEGAFPAHGLVLPDVARNVVHFLEMNGNHTLLSFDATKYTLQAARSLPTSGADARDLIAVGEDTLGYRTVGVGIHFVRRDTIQPVQATPPPASQRVGSLLNLPMTILDITEDPRTGDVLAAVPGYSAVHPNSVVRIDPVSGKVKGAFWAGSNPLQLAIACDAKTLYVGQAGSAGVSAIDIESGSIRGTIHLGGIFDVPAELAAHPLDPSVMTAVTSRGIHEVRAFASEPEQVRRFTSFASPGYRADGKQLRGISSSDSTAAALLTIDIENRASPTDVQYSPYKPSTNHVGDRLFSGAGLLVDEWGTVANAESLGFVTRLHTDRASRSLYAISAERNRIFELEENADNEDVALYAFDLDNFALRETKLYPIGSRGTFRKFLLLSGGRFAILTRSTQNGGSSQLLIGTLDPMTPVTGMGKPSASTGEPGVLRIPLPITAMAYHPPTGKLYTAVAEYSAWAPGAIVPVDPSDGTVGEPGLEARGIHRIEYDSSTESLLVAENLGSTLRWFRPEENKSTNRLDLQYRDGIWTNITPKLVQRNLRTLWDFDVLPAGQGVVVSTEVPGGNLPQSGGVLRIRDGVKISEFMHPVSSNRVYMTNDAASGGLVGLTSNRFLQFLAAGDGLQLTSEMQNMPTIPQPSGRPAFEVEGSIAYVQQATVNVATRKITKTIRTWPLQDERVLLDPSARRLIAAGRESAGNGWNLVLMVYHLDSGIPLARRVLTSFGQYPANEALSISDLASCGPDCIAVSANIENRFPTRVVRSELFLIHGLNDEAMPAIPDEGVVNAASFRRAAQVSPGEILSLFGSNLGPVTGVSLRLEEGRVTEELGGTRAYMDGIPMPLLYAGEFQVNAIVPYSVPVGGHRDIVVETPGGRSTPVSVYVLSGSPGLFSREATGIGQAAVLNQDYSINSPENPARRGEAVMVFGTGGGPADREIEAGALATTDLWRLKANVSASVGGQPATVEYAGGAPGLVNGVNQFNVRIPDTVTAGTAVPLVVSISGRSSQDKITIAIQD